MIVSDPDFAGDAGDFGVPDATSDELMTDAAGEGTTVSTWYTDVTSIALVDADGRSGQFVMLAAHE